ncbi:MAG: hypothetical protein P4M13_02975 [Alphaproteobacteria bacterium]|nr:hypothetical protein [Alphaproteobacteria bacterium]
MSEDDKKTILVVDDDSYVIEGYVKTFEKYPNIRLLFATNACEALTHFTVDKPWPDVLITEIFLLYGDDLTRIKLRGAAETSEIKAGKQLVRHIIKTAPDYRKSCPWIAISTCSASLSDYVFMRDALEGRGRGYLKSIDKYLLENDVAWVLGIEPKVPKELFKRLYPDYRPPAL